MRREREKINMLMNVDNYFGEHTGRLAPMLLFLLVSAAPFLLYTFTISVFVPLKWMLLFEVFWTARMGLLILGKENAKLKQYLLETNNGYLNENDENETDDSGMYATANDMVRVAQIFDDGLIEYINGHVSYILTGYCMTYMDDVSFTLDFEEFLKQLRGFEYDIHCHMVVNEFKLQNDMQNLKVYKDKEMMRERMEFYVDQDKECEKTSKLFKINIAVKASKYDWKKLKSKLDEVIVSRYSGVFKDLYICDKIQVSETMSRDTCANVDYLRMLVEKYKNEEYFDSEVLYYGQDIPEEYQQKKSGVGLSKRRVTLKE